MKQFKAITSGNTQVIAPCEADAFDLTSAQTFSVKYVDAAGVPVGDAAPAQQYTATSFVLTLVASRNSPFVPGQLIAVITAGGASTVYVIPR